MEGPGSATVRRAPHGTHRAFGLRRARPAAGHQRVAHPHHRPQGGSGVAGGVESDQPPVVVVARHPCRRSLIARRSGLANRYQAPWHRQHAVHDPPPVLEAVQVVQRRIPVVPVATRRHFRRTSLGPPDAVGRGVGERGGAHVAVGRLLTHDHPLIVGPGQIVDLTAVVLAGGVERVAARSRPVRAVGRVQGERVLVGVAARGQKATACRPGEVVDTVVGPVDHDAGSVEATLVIARPPDLGALGGAVAGHPAVDEHQTRRRNRLSRRLRRCYANLGDRPRGAETPERTGRGPGLGLHRQNGRVVGHGGGPERGRGLSDRVADRRPSARLEPLHPGLANIVGRAGVLSGDQGRPQRHQASDARGLVGLGELRQPSPRGQIVTAQQQRTIRAFALVEVRASDHEPRRRGCDSPERAVELAGVRRLGHRHGPPVLTSITGGEQQRLTRASIAAFGQVVPADGDQSIAASGHLLQVALGRGRLGPGPADAICRQPDGRLGDADCPGLTDRHESSTGQSRHALDMVGVAVEAGHRRTVPRLRVGTRPGDHVVARCAQGQPRSALARDGHCCDAGCRLVDRGCASGVISELPVGPGGAGVGRPAQQR